MALSLSIFSVFKDSEYHALISGIPYILHKMIFINIYTSATKMQKPTTIYLKLKL